MTDVPQRETGPSGGDPKPKRGAKGERSIDFGAQLAREAQKKVRETARIQAQRAREAPPPPAAPPPAALATPSPAASAEDAPRESLVHASGPVVRPADPPRAKVPLRKKLLALALTLLLALVGVETAARLLLHEPDQLRGKPIGACAFADSLAARSAGSLGPPLRLDRATGFALLPDQDGEQPFEEAPRGSYHLHTNGLGLRDDRPLLPKDAGTYRVLVLGDSMTFGLGLERAQAFPAVLEHALGAELGRPLDVVNAGVPGWGQREEVAFLERKGADLAPDLVLLELTVANDVLDNLRYKDGPGDLVPDPRGGQDLVEHPLFQLPLGDASRAWRLLLWHVGRHVVRYRAMRDPARLERTRLLIRRARDLAAALHARFALVLAPSVVQVDDGVVEAALGTRRVNDALARLAKEDGIPVYDPLLALRSARGLGKRSYFAKDRHWNEVGHGIVGEGLAQWLAGQLR